MSAKEEFDPAILATLTDEERAAITGGDADDLEALKAIAAAGGEEEIDGEDGDDDDDDDIVDDGEVAKPVDAQPDPIQADDAPPPAPEKPRVVYDYKLPDDYTTQVDAIRTKEDALAQQFKDGDLDFEEYRAEARKLDIEREALADMRIKAAVSEELNQQSGDAEWHAALRTFNATTAKADGIDYAKDLAKQADFDLFLNTLGGKPENADKDIGWFISEAHKRVKALHGVTSPAPTPNKDKARRPNLEALPKTLVDVPGSDGPGDVSDEFSALDTLDGMAFEDALANLKRTNPAAFARYEAR